MIKLKLKKKKIKKLAADNQDNVFKIVQELKEQIDLEKNSKKDLKARHGIRNHYYCKLAEKDIIITHLKNQMNTAKCNEANLVEIESGNQSSDDSANSKLKEKVTLNLKYF